MKGTHLGELEELVLLAVASLHGEAYGNAILDFLDRYADRGIALSTLHVALQRLEKKRFVTSKFGESTPRRGGRRKRYFEVTAAGYAAVRASREVRDRMWKLIPKPALR